MGEVNMINSEIVKELGKVVGEKYVSDQPEITFLYHYDFITAEPCNNAKFSGRSPRNR